MSAASPGERAYDAMRLAVVPWLRERRLRKEKERVEAARYSARVLTAGTWHSLALRNDGRITCFGTNNHGQAPPDGVEGDFVAIAAGGAHSLVLRSGGSVACWGNNDYRQAPPGGVDGDFVAIAAGSWHSLALRRDGGIACLGLNGEGQAPPGGVDGPFGHVDV